MPTDVMEQKVESLEVFQCQQALRYSGICGENADYRISIPKLTVTLCAAHAKPFMSGDKKLQAVKCNNCNGICKPGFIHESGVGNFCTQDCRDFFHAPSDGSRLMYR